MLSAPVGPCSPVGPRGPVTVLSAPVGPCSPVGPCGPVFPDDTYPMLYTCPTINCEEGSLVARSGFTFIIEYVVLFCAGMLSNSVIDELFPIVKDKHTLLDFGSVFDIFINDSRIVRRAVVKDDKLQVIRDKYNHDWLYLD